MLATVIIPCGVGHVPFLPRAVRSAKAQTIPCQVLHQVDLEARGPGYVRNRLVEQANTPYVVFLDADDELTPDFLARCLLNHAPGHYCYTDWFCDDSVVTAPDCNAWLNKTFHLVTAFVPRWMHLAVGGFDETLPGIEDADYYLKFRQHQFCGLRVPHPLVRYHGDGQRSTTFRQRDDYDALRMAVSDRYAGGLMACGECGGSKPVLNVSPRQEGDVLARVKYAPRQITWGGRTYARPLTINAQMWVDPQHVMQRPDLWERVAPTEPGVDLDTMRRMALEALGGRTAAG